MKKLSILILFLCLFLVGCGAEKKPDNLLDEIKHRNKIIVGIKDDSKPFGYLDKNGEIVGFDADIAKQIAHSIFISDNDNHVEFVPLKPSQRISALNTRKVDIVIATLSINSARKDIIDFSDPYYVAGQAIMVPRYSRLSSISQMNGRSVAVVLGTTGEKTVRTLAPNATSIGSMTYQDAFEHLKEGNVSAILADDSLLYGLLLENRGYKILPHRYTKEYYAIGLRQGEENASLKRHINETLAVMKRNGKLSRIKEKWIPR